MLFLLYSIMKWRNTLVLAPKKSVALQEGRQSSIGIMPISGVSGAGVTTSSAGQALPTVTPMPSVGQAGVGAQGTPSDVAKQPVMEAIPLPMMGRTELPFMLVALATVGAT